MQAPSKFKLILIFIVCLTLFACASAPLSPPSNLSQLQIRQLQSREYSHTKLQSVIRSVISALQDEGFIIASANENLGLVTAAMEKYEEDSRTKNYVNFMYGPGIGTYQTTKHFEASVSVAEHNKVTRVRINIVVKAINNAGGIIWSQPVYDQATYQNIFSKIDKSLYLYKQNL